MWKFDLKGRGVTAENVLLSKHQKQEKNSSITLGRCPML